MLSLLGAIQPFSQCLEVDCIFNVHRRLEPLTCFLGVIAICGSVKYSLCASLNILHNYCVNHVMNLQIENFVIQFLRWLLFPLLSVEVLIITMHEIVVFTQIYCILSYIISLSCFLCNFLCPFEESLLSNFMMPISKAHVLYYHIYEEI